jgi:hypothetical protein
MADRNVCPTREDGIPLAKARAIGHDDQGRGAEEFPMAHRRSHEEDWDDDGSDSDGEETVPCPYCRRQIHEDSERCPYCENYLSREDAPPRPKPWWLVVGVLVCLAIVAMWVLNP